MGTGYYFGRVKKSDNQFQRAQPLSTPFLEKPMASWASGKIKRLYDGYENFCQEIGRLLGDPAPQTQENLKIKATQNAEIIEEFEFLWQASDPSENILQLLTILTDFYKAGFVMESFDRTCQIKSFFAEDSGSLLAPLLEKTFNRITPPLAANSLKPVAFEAHPLLQTIGLKNLDWQEDTLAFHFWLYPDSATSLLLFSDTPEPRRRDIVFKTQALIQRRFYD